jgi:hypothetical protein
VTAPACSRCRTRPPRAGLRTCAPCAAAVAARGRATKHRPNARRAPPPPRPPTGYRVVPGTRFAVDRDGMRAVKFCDDQWREVDLAEAPLVRRAMRLLVERAWTA